MAIRSQARRSEGVQAAAQAAARLLTSALDEPPRSPRGVLLPFPPRSGGRETLAEIALRLGSPRYRNAEAYHMLFAPLRDRPVVLCEIPEPGTARDLWGGYFTQLRQLTPQTLPAGETPGIVVDAGSADCAAQQAAFLELFPRLAPGGIYLVENLRPAADGGLRSADLFRSFSERRRFLSTDAEVNARFAQLAPQIAGVLMLQTNFNKNRRDQVAVIQKR